MTFANNLKKAISDAGITQSELARRTGINKAIISEYLSGKYEPKQQNTYKIAVALNIKPSVLMSGFESEPESAPAYYNDPETAEIADRLKNQPGMRMLFDASKDATPKDLEIAANLLRQLKGTD